MSKLVARTTIVAGAVLVALGFLLVIGIRFQVYNSSNKGVVVTIGSHILGGCEAIGSPGCWLGDAS